MILPRLSVLCYAVTTAFSGKAGVPSKNISLDKAKFPKHLVKYIVNCTGDVCKLAKHNFRKSLFSSSWESCRQNFSLRNTSEMQRNVERFWIFDQLHRCLPKMAYFLTGFRRVMIKSKSLAFSNEDFTSSLLGALSLLVVVESNKKWSILKPGNLVLCSCRHAIGKGMKNCIFKPRGESSKV